MLTHACSGLRALDTHYPRVSAAPQRVAFGDSSPAQNELLGSVPT